MELLNPGVSFRGHGGAFELRSEGDFGFLRRIGPILSDVYGGRVTKNYALRLFQLELVTPYNGSRCSR